MQLLETSNYRSERIAWLTPLAKGPFKKEILFSIALPRVYAPTLVHATMHGQVINDLGYNGMMYWYIVVGDSDSDLFGKEITEAKGINVTPSMHHLAFSDNGYFILRHDDIDKYVNVIVCCGSTATKSGDRLRVDQDYGRLQVAVIG